MSINTLANNYLQSRSERDLQLLWERLKPGLTSYSYGFLNDYAAASDVVADAFVKIWRKIDTYDSRWCFSTWCYRIVRNESMQYLRKRRSVSASKTMSMSGDKDYVDYVAALVNDALMSSSDEPDFTEFDSRGPSTEELHEKAVAEMDRLPDQYKGILIDREINEMKYSEIAEKYGLEINTVKTRIIRAREKVCDAMKVERGRRVTQ